MERTAFEVMVGFMRMVLEKENLAQALLVAVTATKYDNDMAVAAAQLGHDTRMQCSIAAGALVTDWLPELAKEYERLQ